MTVHGGDSAVSVPRPGRDLALDLIALALVFVVLSLAVPAGFVLVRALQQGLSIDALRTQDAEQLMRLIGADGVLTLLALQNSAFVVVPLARVVWWRREPLTQLGLQGRDLSGLIWFGLRLGVAVIISNILIGGAFVALGVRQNQAEQYPLFAGDYLGQAGFFIGAALLAPIGEEILFRGYVFNTLRRIWAERPRGQAGAYIISALLFALAHSLAATQGVIGLLAPAFAMGLLLAWGVQRSGSIVPSIVAHGLNNGLALAALLATVNGLAPSASL